MDVTLQRVNQLHSMGLIEKHSDEYTLTETGHKFVDEAVMEWADVEWTLPTDAEVTAGIYEMAVQARAVDPEFRVTVL